ncbi:Putative auto-transporter adhesin, head GIN domain [Erythrobacter litoralis]|jgi:hypothetical protein|uniref:Putative auto-transporter adhesin head GIN domain-containing protein n=1 Tax=Erythrobacter litoralis TaxID=39960 RepID=A0A074MV28_9SPHN|nr:head GIN domain-containing protein [Erythrobacter litoralis]AOL21990.1 Putative auto-transporter adhesin, head GIN domain [Erythrobacter litoralis]KEO96610.1 hypothetical protein EH32_10305 [Erythrobacter litoralis]MEE4338908.1 head GIN domain-containing protein [Erythrobacter sp.]
MIERLIRRMAPVAALALGTALGGCNMDFKVNGMEGVPLSELDMSGATPSELVLASGDRVILREGDALAITVDGDPEETGKLRFSLDDDTLGITREENSWGSGSSVTVNVTMPPPEGIVIAGSGTILAQRMARDAELTIGGSGNIEVETIAADSLEVSIGGSGSVKGAGTASRLEVNIGGSGDVDLSGLKADRAEIAIGGAGDVAFASDGTVEASIAGSGDVRVTGSAKCEVTAVGSGKLTCSPAPAGEPEAGAAEAALKAPAAEEPGEG